jgi:hypothetical protein
MIRRERPLWNLSSMTFDELARTRAGRPHPYRANHLAASTGASWPMDLRTAAEIVMAGKDAK